MKCSPRNRDRLFKQVCKLRLRGFGYRTIAAKLNSRVPWTTIRNWTWDIPSDPNIAHKKRRLKPRKRFEDLKGHGNIRRRLLEDREYKCELCGRVTWLGKPIPLEVHHIDGNKKNNKKANLKLVCYNCHSLTATFRNKRGSNPSVPNIKKGYTNDKMSATNSSNL